MAAKLTIEKATVTGSFKAADKVYDGTRSATISERSLTAGVIGTDDVNLAGGSATFEDKNVGTAKKVTGVDFTLSGAKAGNYQLASTTLTTTANITRRPITVTANPQTKVYGSPDPALTYSVTNGSLAGDAFSGSLSRGAGESVAGSPYAFEQNTLTAGPNYDLTYVGANRTITHATHTGDPDHQPTCAQSLHLNTTTPAS